MSNFFRRKSVKVFALNCQGQTTYGRLGKTTLKVTDDAEGIGRFRESVAGCPSVFCRPLARRFLWAGRQH